MVKRVAIAVTLLPAVVSAQQSAWAQCGGTGFSGSSSCVSDYACSSLNPYYYQCVPGTAIAAATTAAAAATTTTAAAATTTAAATAITTTATAGSTATTNASTPTTTLSDATTASGSGTTPPTTLVSGYYWVRAVESPNFHSYLQAAPTSTPYPGPGDAYLLSADTAGQFNVVDGQLVYYTGSSTLYMGVEDSANKTQRTLQTWFNTTENEYGTFAFQGDTLTWTVSDIDRPNTAAWLVCGDENRLYINTGAYLYDTPDGCVDETIHYYGGSTANV